MAAEKKEPQQKLVMALVCWFLGAYGIHALMMGYKNWWYRIPATIFTCGFGALWGLYDLVMILTGKMKMADGKDLL